MSQVEIQECPVCYEVLNINTVVNLQCGHNQCKTCFWKWTNEQGANSCCLCRKVYLTHENHTLPGKLSEGRHQLEDQRLDSQILGLHLERVEERIDAAETLEEEIGKRCTNLQDTLKYLGDLHEDFQYKIEARQREMHFLGLSYSPNATRRNDLLLAKFYEMRHKKSLKIAEKKRDGKFKKEVGN